MDTTLWSDDQFRSFFAALRDHSCFAEPDDAQRDAFLVQARLRLAPEVQRRLLTDLGATTDAQGIARVAWEALEDEAWGKRRSWLLVSTEPWGVLVDLVTRQIRESYRASVRRPRAKALKELARASDDAPGGA
ncbi:hypothetical protein [Microbacterium sp. TNHR37B]|uniref:hypothetical protein n=1 Tax=Microbacterium sp. TNHR37B TaxID=1775956 RepID=UPI0007B306D4|nr:hypothetical protein [Microbacterium sp. TNHR37B]KZE91835.1 hypothetical protein AVP41_01384 [Microbacterium sp. TNHR37B]